MLDNLKTWLGSFYSPQAYRTATASWSGIAAWYLAILSVVCAVSCHIKYQMLFNEVTHQVRDTAHTIPGLSLKHGRLLLKSESPMVIGDQAKKLPLLVIDTTADNRALLGKGAPIVVRDQDIRIYGFTEAGNTSVPKITLPLQNIFGEAELNIDPSQIANWICNFCLIISATMFSANLLFIYCTSLIQALFWGWIAYAVAGGSSGQYSYAALVRASALALTPSLAIRAITGLFGIDLPVLLDGLVLAIYFGYLYFAYRCLSPVAETATSPASNY